MKTITDEMELAFRMMAWRMMAWLNDNQPYRGGVFETPLGILEIWSGRNGWEYRYLQAEPLPIEWPTPLPTQ